MKAQPPFDAAPLQMTDQPHDRRADDKIMTLIRLIEFFVEEHKEIGNTEYLMRELRANIIKLLAEIETVRAVNDRLLKEIASLKEAERGGLMT